MATWLIAILTALLAAATLAPVSRIPHGFVRVCDFPKLQIIALTIAAAVATLVFLPWGTTVIVLVAVQVLIILVQSVACVRFTPLWRVQSLRFDGTADNPAVVRILVSNVKMSNRDHGRLIEVVRREAPDFAAFLECDGPWQTALSELKDILPHALEHPLDNSYGMIILSRIPFRSAEFRFVFSDEVPSARIVAETGAGDPFALYVVHPEPPVPYADTIGRDGELILLARDAKAESLPTIVTGDMNDVAWSPTTRRFQRLSGLLDPRVGRGFYNSFDARYPLLRWPLDHLFHDPRFRLVRLERLPNIGSDHFPMLFELALTSRNGADETPQAADSEDLEEAREVTQAADNLDREPIGSDWEK
ncbi:endonuclease/exonuclease/phosphatase family protein [Microbaculum marinum]|uniref:Endonuclease/exonuclease/phosphatase family protein n=1 Tax=Microbaculum marinum TaxID=1764581 RepID=A0AAW9RM05_9HYPH